MRKLRLGYFEYTYDSKWKSSNDHLKKTPSNYRSEAKNVMHYQVVETNSIFFLVK